MACNDDGHHCVPCPDLWISSTAVRIDQTTRTMHRSGFLVSSVGFIWCFLLLDVFGLVFATYSNDERLTINTVAQNTFDIEFGTLYALW
jgi:hypothetical protein